MNLEHVNNSELVELLRRQGYRVQPSLPRARLEELLYTGEEPRPEEMAATMVSRKRLEVWVQRNLHSIGSQLPCKGEYQGRCTIYDCPDGRHVDCYLSAERGGHLI